MKRIAYLITDNGVEGRDPTEIVAAFWTEAARDAHLDKDKSKAWRSTSEQIVDTEPATKEALAKLDGLEYLLVHEYVETQRHATRRK